ncbi:MAG: glycosyltransferase family 2 protein [Roseburia sp.]|nr:glycosyltransferase family 2 protein [Roseburia sp.]MCM1556802.1 glycosyltransferase family 2 protein [Anaeroplasma bactoclasticum]
MDIGKYIVEWWNQTFNFSDIMSIYRSITNIIIYIFNFFLLYRSLYTIIGLFGKAPKYVSSPMDKSYAVVIAARNEEKVIGNLIDSLKKQTYDASKITIFVVADNCTDHTASICRSLGAICYERFDKNHISKGYALEYLFEQIKCDYGILSFDYYLVFDSDNLAKQDFIEKMNDAFHTGFDIVTSFRNIKNFDTNIISSGYGIHFYRNTLCSHRPRSILNVSTHLTGTGYGIKAEHLQDGWHYTTLTEDNQLTTISIANHLKIGYCEEAEIYDEQPTNFKTAWKQRVRWRKGGLINFKRQSFKAFKEFFKTGNWSCYDNFWQYFPYDLFFIIITFLLQLFIMIYSLVSQGSYNPLIFLKSLGHYFLGIYTSNLLIGTLVVIRERKRIHCNFFKLLLYLFLFPWFDMISIFVVLVAVFKRVKWDPIIHNDSKKIEEMNNNSI